MHLRDLPNLRLICFHAFPAREHEGGERGRMGEERVLCVEVEESSKYMTTPKETRAAEAHKEKESEARRGAETIEETGHASAPIQFEGGTVGGTSGVRAVEKVLQAQ